MMKLTLEEIDNFRSQLADYPEALAALDEIELKSLSQSKL